MRKDDSPSMWSTTRVNSTPTLEEISGGNKKQHPKHGKINYKLLYTTSRMQRKHNAKTKNEVHARKETKAQTATKKYTRILTSKIRHPTLFLVFNGSIYIRTKTSHIRTKTNNLLP